MYVSKEGEKYRYRYAVIRAIENSTRSLGRAGGQTYR